MKFKTGDIFYMEYINDKYQGLIGEVTNIVQANNYNIVMYKIVKAKGIKWTLNNKGAMEVGSIAYDNSFVVKDTEAMEMLYL